MARTTYTLNTRRLRLAVLPMALLALGVPTLTAQAQSAAPVSRPKMLMEPTIAQVNAKRDKVQAMIVRLQANMDPINGKIADTEAEDGLRPAYFTSREGLQRMREGLATTQGLVTQRGKLVDDFVTAARDVPGTGIMSIDAKRELVVAIRDMSNALLASYKPLEAAQLESLKVRLELVERGEQALGAVTLRDGELQFQRQEDRDDFARLQQRLAQVQERIQTLAAQPGPGTRHGTQVSVVAPLADAAPPK